MGENICSHGFYVARLCWPIRSANQCDRPIKSQDRCVTKKFKEKQKQKINFKKRLVTQNFVYETTLGVLTKNVLCKILLIYYMFILYNLNSNTNPNPYSQIRLFCNHRLQTTFFIFIYVFRIYISRILSDFLIMWINYIN